jgi:hypothetical protein
MIGLSLFSSLTFAFEVNEARGREIISFSSPNYQNEICLLPNHSGQSAYSEADVKIEQELCHFDLYGQTPNMQRVAVCPKIKSTNPGMHLLLDHATSAFPDRSLNCGIRDESLNLVAKHKQSISCSYTPSILMYYHLSRRLGNILNIPVAVVRTIDKSEHQKWTTQALSFFDPKNNELIHQNWQHYQRAHQTPQKYPQIFTEDAKFLYGALLLNAGGEQYYGEVNGKGDYATRELRFQKQPPFLQVASEKSIDVINTGLNFKQRLQNVVQMKDLADMILMDQLLNQADRVGNIHYFESYFRLEGDQVARTEGPAPDAVLIKEMTLRDNDCGIIKENRFKAFKILEKVRHMDPKTYHHFLTWVRELNSPETIDFLRHEVLLTSKDLNDPNSGLIANAKALSKLLITNCRSGYLKLDVSIETFDRPYRFDPAQCEP